MQQCSFAKLPSVLLQKMKEAGVRTIILDGFTGSGKSTAADGLIKILKEEGKKVQEFRADWFVIDRDKRNYKENPALMRLTKWADIPDGKKYLTFMSEKGDATKELIAYDRNTGKRSKSMMLETVKDNEYFVIEGLYALKMAEQMKRPALRVFFVMDDATTTQRLYARNTYIPRERLEYEVREIYLPSMKEYDAELRTMKNLLRIDTRKFESVLFH